LQSTLKHIVGFIGTVIKKKWVKAVLNFLIVVAVFFFVFNALNFQWEEFSKLKIIFSKNYAYWLILSLGFIISSLMISAIGWVWITNVLHAQVPYHIGVRVFFISQLGRYIPGKLWTFMGRFMLCDKQNVPTTVISESILYEVAMSFLAASAISGLTLAISKNTTLGIDWLPYAIFCTVLLSLIAPKLFFFGLNWILIKFGKEPIKTVIKYRHLLAYFILNVFLWLLMGYGIYLLSLSFLSIPIQQSIIFPGVFCIAWIGGFLSVLTPSGIGVREGILTYFLSQFISPSNALVIAICSRIWFTLAELLCLLIAIGISIILKSGKNHVYPQ